MSHRLTVGGREGDQLPVGQRRNGQKLHFVQPRCGNHRLTADATIEVFLADVTEGRTRRLLHITKHTSLPRNGAQHSLFTLGSVQWLAGQFVPDLRENGRKRQVRFVVF